MIGSLGRLICLKTPTHLEKALPSTRLKECMKGFHLTIRLHCTKTNGKRLVKGFAEDFALHLREMTYIQVKHF